MFLSKVFKEISKCKCHLLRHCSFQRWGSLVGGLSYGVTKGFAVTTVGGYIKSLQDLTDESPEESP